MTNSTTLEVETNWIAWIIFGALAGWIASIVMGKNKQMGAITNNQRESLLFSNDYYVVLRGILCLSISAIILRDPSIAKSALPHGDM